MLNLPQNFISPRPPHKPCTRDLAVIGALFLLTFTLHYSALQGYWRWDDGLHLFNVSMYSPWSVFFDPQVTRFVSGNQVAPWNLFVYQINYALFGLNPFPYYVHHLASMACAAAGLYLLLRHWLGRWQALTPAAMLVVGSPSVHMAQQLMVGHYLDGLLFACLSLWAYIHAVQRAQWRWAVLAAIFYLLSTLCKEVYVTWVALTLLLPLPSTSSSSPNSSWTVARWGFAAPTLAVALAYAVMRISVFSGMGGYHGLALGSLEAVPAFFSKLVDVLVSGLVGGGIQGVVAAMLCVVCIGVGLTALSVSGRKAMLVGLGLVIVVVVFPLLFVVHQGVNPEGHTRYLWVPWVAICVLWGLKWPASLARWRIAALIVFTTAVGQHALAQREHDRAANTMFDAHFRFALNPPPDQVLVPHELFSATSTVIQIMYAHAAVSRLEPGRPLAEPQLLRNEPTTAIERARIRAWDDRCLCLVPLDSLPLDKQKSIVQGHLELTAGVLPLRGPLPRFAHGYSGSIDSVEVEGKQMRVKGWTPTLGPGRRMALGIAAQDITVRGASLVSTERPDVVLALHQPDLLMSGFEATLSFDDESMARAASEIRCAIVLSHLPGQQHQYLLMPVKGQVVCDDALIPEATKGDSESG